METIEFDTAYSAATGEYIGGYVPTCEYIDGSLFIDGAHWVSGPGATWHALTGHRSFAFGAGNADPVFEPAETATDEQIREWVRDAGGDIFAIVEVGAHDDADPVFPDEPDYCAEHGCAHEPAGWAVIYRDADA